jgi:hypothetical protein
MAAVHEDMHQRAGQDQQVWQRTEDVRCMLGQEVGACDGDADKEGQAGG